MTLIARSNREARAFASTDTNLATSALKSQIDHIVVVAHTLEQGVAWCEAILGITPEAGGEHPQFGTHNRLFKIATPTFPLVYFEIIAIKNNATNNIAVKSINTLAIGQNSTKNNRWFDMDDAALQAAVAKEPRLDILSRKRMTFKRVATR